MSGGEGGTGREGRLSFKGKAGTNSGYGPAQEKGMGFKEKAARGKRGG